MRRLKVLLVEDDEGARLLYSYMLAVAGYKVNAVRNGLEAFAEIWVIGCAWDCPRKSRKVMAKKAAQKRNGVYQRKDRPGFWITWKEAQGHRAYRKTDAANITQPKQIRAAELLNV